jgi:hypothetical protein
MPQGAWRSAAAIGVSLTAMLAATGDLFLLAALPFLVALDWATRQRIPLRCRTTGAGTLVGVRLHPPILGAIDNWRRSEQDLPSRSEAIRRLVEQALSAKRKR